MTSECSQLLVNRELVCRLYDVWSALPEGKPRQALSPLALGAHLLPHLALLRTLPAEFRCELVGEQAGELAGALRRGQTAGQDRAPGADCSNAFRMMRAVAESRRPGAQFTGLVNRSGNLNRCFAMTLPLSISGHAANDLLIGIWPSALGTQGPQETGTDTPVQVEDLIAELYRTRPLAPRLAIRRIAFGGESIASC